ncbi:Xaa-Pro peptidase family protein [Arthrobacter sp. M4]|uniref:M24 family metallopeptidase n=1 Tax=Arthrobacter sp. M4 TaxID=218160 RepID=UPI001CDCB017|nr:Xaa-Pro peptidase family protein [Arthrobacter sp. M4]MCA4132533.1 Xaa-Pro peptidase family protein [Arthrobacter sp. M4]
MTLEVPFNARLLDELLEQHDMVAVIATSKHNVQHLLGGYRYFFFAISEATGISRYLPALGIPRGDLDSSFYVGAGNENWGTEEYSTFWVPDVQNVSWTSAQTAEVVAESLRARGIVSGRVGIEKSFLPADALDVLRDRLPDIEFVEALPVFETLRAVKTPYELELVRAASVAIVESMDAVFGQVKPGMTKKDISEMFRREQTNRGLYYEYALTTIGGGNMNRSPSSAVWESGTTLSLDSGGMLDGYIGDLSRMGIDTEPTPRMVDLLNQVEEVQQAARTVIRDGARGGDIYDIAEKTIAGLPDGQNIRFVGHGMGLITHEAPRLTSTGPVPYPGTHRELPLESGMVLSIESWFEDYEAGFIKMEDTIIVTDTGWEAPGDECRGWNRTGGRI